MALDPEVAASGQTEAMRLASERARACVGAHTAVGIAAG